MSSRLRSSLEIQQLIEIIDEEGSTLINEKDYEAAVEVIENLENDEENICPNVEVNRDKVNKAAHIKREIKQSYERKNNKNRRERGQEYVSTKTIVRNGKKIIKSCVKSARKVGERCKCCKSGLSRVFCCDIINELDRSIIFEQFWKLSDEGKRVFIKSHVTTSEIKRKRNIDNSDETKRKCQHSFHLNVHGTLRRVCKNMFLSSLGIGEKYFRNVISGKASTTVVRNTKKMENVMKGGKKRQRKTDVRYNSALFFCRGVLKSLPRLPSHYNRKHSKLQYLQRPFTSKQEVYR